MCITSCMHCSCGLWQINMFKSMFTSKMFKNMFIATDVDGLMTILVDSQQILKWRKFCLVQEALPKKGGSSCAVFWRSTNQYSCQAMADKALFKANSIYLIKPIGIKGLELVCSISFSKEVEKKIMEISWKWLEASFSGLSVGYVCSSTFRFSRLGYTMVLYVPCFLEWPAMWKQHKRDCA